MAKEINPRLVFERLFGSPAKRRRRARPAASATARASSISSPRTPAISNASSAAPISASSTNTSTGVREIEQRMAAAPSRRSRRAPTASPPTGRHSQAIIRSTSALMCDLMVLAFQADLTRIATFVFANEGSNRSYRVHRRAGRPSRPVAPRRQQGRSRRRSRRSTSFHIEQFAYLLGQAQGDPGRRRHAARQLA